MVLARAGTSWSGHRGGQHLGLHLGAHHPHRPTRPRRVIQPNQPGLRVSTSPQHHRGLTASHPLGDLRTGQPGSANNTIRARCATLAGSAFDRARRSDSARSLSRTANTRTRFGMRHYPAHQSN